MKNKLCACLFVILLCLNLIIGCDSNNEYIKTEKEYQFKNLDSKFDDIYSGIDIDINKKLLNMHSRQQLISTPKKYTIMMYMVGSDLESRYPILGGAAASRDLVEIVQSGIDINQTNVLVYTGGTNNWWTEGIPNDRNSVFLLNERGFELVGSTDSVQNMGSAQCLYDFLNYSYSYFPASNYGLIFWDHGGGPLIGYGIDEVFDGDGLFLEEMRKAMDSSPFGPDNRLQFVGFDACLMAGLEVASLWDDYADYMIAATESEPNSGWDYRFLASLNDTEDGLVIAKACIDAYYATYNEEQQYDEDIVELAAEQKTISTLSCIDLHEVDNFMMDFDSLMNMLARDMEAVYPKIAQLRTDVTRYGSSADFEYDLIDLFDFIQHLPNRYQHIISSDSINKLVVYNRTNIDNSNGVSLYMPYFWNDLYESELYRQLYYKHNVSDAYRLYLDAFAKQRFSQHESINNLELEGTEDIDTWFVIDQELIDTISSLTCDILYSPKNDNNYIPIIRNLILEFDDNGNIDKPNRVNAIIAEGSETPIPIRELCKKNGKASIIIENLWLCGKGIRQPVYIRATIDSKTETFTLNDVYQKPSEFKPLAKGLPITAGWDSLETEIVSVVSTYSKENILLPIDDWEKGNIKYSAELALSKKISDGKLYIPIPVDSLPGTIVAQIILEDVYGNRRISDLITIK